MTADFIKEGRSVATPRIDTDTARVYGRLTDFLDTATDPQRDAIPALTDQLVGAAVWTAHQGSLEYQARAAQQSGADVSKDVRTAEALKTYEKGKIRRNQLEASLRGLSGQDPKLLARIATAYGTTQSAADLERSLDALIALGREMLKDNSPAMVKRKKGSRLDKAWLDRAAKLVDDVRATGDAACATLASAAVSQAEVDDWDELDLALFELIMDICEAGHAEDPTIPRLIPIALRGYFSPSRKPKPAKEEGEPPKPTGDK